jgi:undecaprenyl-diphosphatase
MEFLQAIILGIVEGITEFIPVSSTGHLIIVGHLLGYKGEKAAFFEIVIQFAAILAVVWLYKERFLGLLDFKNPDQSSFRGINGLKLLAWACAPAFVLGFLFRDFIKAYLFSPVTVALALIVGGIILLFIDRIAPPPTVTTLDKITWKEALIIGVYQCFALWPGVSRSAATITGGMLTRLDRKTAAEFSFFAAVPIMTLATAYDFVKSMNALSFSDLPFFTVGFVTSFIFALLAVKYFIQLLSRMTLVPFGWYRIGVGLVVMLLVVQGVLK